MGHVVGWATLALRGILTGLWVDSPIVESPPDIPDLSA
jgi:hypothetical protein